MIKGILAEVNLSDQYNKNNHGKDKNEFGESQKFIVLKNLFDFACKSKITQYKIRSCQKHKDDDDVVYPRQVIPVGQTCIFGGKPPEAMVLMAWLMASKRDIPAKYKSKVSAKVKET